MSRELIVRTSDENNIKYPELSVTVGGATAGDEYSNLAGTSNKYDEKSRILQPNEELLTREELPRCHVCVYIASYTLLILGLPALIYLTLILSDDPAKYFYERTYNTIIVVGINYMVAAVFKKYLNMKTCYTRKCIHVTIFALPLVIDAVTNELSNAFLDVLWATWSIEVLFAGLLTIPVRSLANRIFGNPTVKYEKWRHNALTYCNICELIIDAIDRPEDRPNTLLWAQTQNVLTYITYALTAVLFEYDTDTPMVLLIPVFIVGLGDGLAEPVGVYFGKTGCGTGMDCTFRTHGCCTKYDYTRSVPGSAMVLLFGYIGVAAAYNDFTTFQFILAMIVIPPLGAIVEAKAPHTLDNPFIAFFTAAAAFAILQIPKVTIWDIDL